MLDISSLQYNSENPTMMAIIFTALCALILGILIAFTYEKTSRTVHRPNHFLQAMVLVTIVAATIIQAIGDSVARGLGMLGALSIIRFRTSVKDSRNIVFMFSAIATGIACGVLGFVIAIVGTLIFCATAFLLRFSSFSQRESLVGTLRVELPKNYEDFSRLEKELKGFCKKFVIKSYKVFTGEKKAEFLLYEYELKLKKRDEGGKLMDALNELPEVKVLGLNFQNQLFDTI